MDIWIYVQVHDYESKEGNAANSCYFVPTGFVSLSGQL